MLFSHLIIQDYENCPLVANKNFKWDIFLEMLNEDLESEMLYKPIFSNESQDNTRYVNYFFGI